MSKAAAIICIVLGIVLLAGVAFGVYVLLESTDYFKTSATDFWITVNGTRYSADGEDVVLSDTEIEAHYLVEWLSGKQGYDCKIISTGNDFGYIVDGSIYNWLGIEDLTPAFETETGEKSFTVKAKGKTVADVLQALYPESEVFTPFDEDGFNFKLVVTSVDGRSIALTFRCSVVADGIEIDPPSVAF
ncbi:MAG: hypothetical protein NC332_05805 [Firmicutes bacterium]|nr:hypothetical protein [Bacillota bacterium]